MVVANLQSITLLAAASLLATGCYCPTLSGRYCELSQWPSCPLPNSACPLPTPTAAAPSPTSDAPPYASPDSAPQPPTPQTIPPAPSNAPPAAPPGITNTKHPPARGHAPRGPRPVGGFFGFGLWPALREANAPVPSQQGPDYISPQAKFHPVPTRPVFEPQLAYPVPQFIEPADMNPLRPARLAHSR